MKIRVKVASVNPHQAPAGTVQGNFRFAITGPNGFSQAIEDAALEVTITIPGPGAYAVSVAALSAEGLVLGEPVTGEIRVPEPGQPVTVSVPATLALEIIE